MQSSPANKTAKQLIVIAALMLLSAFSYQAYVFWSDIKKDLSDQLRQQSVQLLDYNRAFFSQQVDQIQTPATAALATAPLSSQQFRNSLAPISTQPQVAGYQLLDSDGQVLLRSGVKPDTELAGHAANAIQLLASTNAPQLSPPLTSGDASFLPLLIPLLDSEGELQGMLAELLKQEGETSYLADFPLIPDSKIWLIDNEGVVYLDYPGNHLSGSSLPGALADKIQQSHLSSSDYNATLLKLNGAEQLTDINYFSEFQLYTLSSVPGAVLQQTWLNRIKPMIFAFAVLIIALIAAYILLSRKQGSSSPSVGSKGHDSLTQAIEQTAHGVVITDPQWRIRYANRHFTMDGQQHQASDIRGSDLSNHPPYSCLAGEKNSINEHLQRRGSWNGEYFTDHNGHWYHYSVSNIGAENDKSAKAGYLFLVQDITTRKKTELKLTQLARNEPMSGLPNRSWGEENLTRFLNKAASNKDQVYLCYLDIDSWATLNDDPGHQLSDTLLKEVAKRLRSSCQQADQVFHMGGYGFMVFLTADETQPLEALAEQLLDKVTLPITQDNKLISITANAGLASSPDDGSTVSDLIKAASIALGEAKRLGRNKYARYNQTIEEKLQRKAKIAAALPAALENDEFYLLYQTKNFIKSGKMMGFEALLRWRSTELGDVSAAEFIPVAEETGHVHDLGRFAIMQACTALANFLEISNRPMRMAVNLSLAQLRNEHIIEYIKDALHTTRLNPKYLELELGEPILSDHLQELLPKLNEIRQMGISLSLDNFGTGYSSLSYLSKLPISSLKIDLTYIRDIVKNPHHAALTHSIISMAHALKLKVVAEGIENKEQLLLLRDYDCDIVQGYLFTRPLTQQDMGDLIEIEKLPKSIKMDDNVDHMF